MYISIKSRGFSWSCDCLWAKILLWDSALWRSFNLINFLTPKMSFGRHLKMIHVHLINLLSLPQTKFAKVVFLHQFVILCTGGWSVSVHAGIHPTGQTPPGQTNPGQKSPLVRHSRADSTPSGDTGNKRAVRILLECENESKEGVIAKLENY